MSVTVLFAFNASGDLAEVCGMVNSALGVSLQPYEGNAEDLFCHFLGLELSLHTCELEDDREVDFSRFRFILGSRTAWGDAQLRAYQLEATALAAYAVLLRGVTREGILVYDVYPLLARYSVSADGVVRDVLSGVDVRFPDHLSDIRGRLTGGSA